MSPSQNQLPQPSSPNQPQTSETTVRRPNPPPSAAVSPTEDIDTAGEVASPNQETTQRQQPIPPPSEPMQYRAIGLVLGKYTPSEEQFTRGMLHATDGQAIDSVLLGRIMSLVKNHLDLETDHLWVVYPRTRQEDGGLHLQIVGVWEPEKLDKGKLLNTDSAEAKEETAPTDLSPTPTDLVQPEDGYFSVRGEVIFQDHEQKQLIVKIRQTPRKDEEKPKFFKLTLKGVLEKKAVGYFWDFQVQRQLDALVIQQAEDIGLVRPRKPKKPFKKGGRPQGKKGPWKDRPSRPGQGPVVKPAGTKPVPRPVKRSPQGGEQQ